MTGRTQNDELYIGIDLSSIRALVSFYTSSMVEPETISTRGGESGYQIPTAICRTASGKLFYGEEAEKRKHEAGASYHQDLLEQALRSDEPEPKEYLLLFLKRLIAFRKNYIRDIEHPYFLAITLPRLDTAATRLFEDVRKQLGLPRDRFRLSDYRESFFDYTIMQDHSIWKNDTMMFDFTGNQLACYHLTIRGKTYPRTAAVSTTSWRVTDEVMDDLKERDLFFAGRIRESFHGSLISGVYLIGEGFDGRWLDQSLSEIGPNKRIFIGKNLHTRGACLGAYRQNHHAEGNIVYRCDYKITHDICMKVFFERKVQYVPLVDFGKNWFDCEFACDLLYNGDTQIGIWERIPDQSDEQIGQLELADFPNRKNKSVRLRMYAKPVSENQLHIRIVDDGFGDFFASTGKQWNFMVPLDGSTV